MEESYVYPNVEPIEPVPRRHKKIFGLLFSVVLVGFVFAAMWGFLITRAPGDFVPRLVTVLPGSTVTAIVDDMAKQNIVRSSNALYITLLSMHRNEPIKAGTYQFDTPLSVFEVAHMLTQTIPQDELISITLPEGMKVKEYAAIADATLTNFDEVEFLRLSSSSEGLLWPETYFVPPDYSATQLFNLLRLSHDEIWPGYTDQIVNSKLTQMEIITLASLVEREANDSESMKMVSGILQNRLAIGMPLQADASIEYVLDRPLNELKPGELAKYLEELDSPYNTYMYRGLPPTPIGNPGKEAIEAVLMPTQSPYLFYITGDDGIFYYAETFAEHQENVAAHLR